MNVEAASGPVMINVVVGPNWTFGGLLDRAFPADHMLPHDFLRAIENLAPLSMKGGSLAS